MLQLGYKPPTDISDFILWHRHEWDKVADHLVNHTMDTQRSWKHVFEGVPNLRHTRVNYVLHLDGGVRAGQCTAAVWSLEAQSTQDDMVHRFPLMMAGTCIAKCVSSFQAELIALDESVSVLTNLVTAQPL